MMKTKPKDYNVYDNLATEKHWTTGSRAKTKDRGENTIDTHMKMKNHDIKGGILTSRLVLL